MNSHNNSQPSITRFTTFVVAAAVLVAASLTFTLNWQIGLATLAFGLLLSGISALPSKNFMLHSRFMRAGIFLDISLVLFLQLTRNAVKTAVVEPLTFFQMIHIGSSLTTVLLYVGVLIFGYRLLKHQKNPLELEQYLVTRKRHLLLGKLCIALRTIGYMSMYSFYEYQS